MKTLKEWAEFYYQKGINICPDNVSFDWTDWRLNKQTLEELKAYDWDTAKAIYAVVGKKGIRALSLLEVENLSVDYRDKLLKRVLSLLGLSKDYPWVVDFTDALCVIIESADIPGMKNKKYKDMELLWQDTIAMPPYQGIHFYSCSIPNERPTHIPNDVLFKCMDTIRDDRLGNKTTWPYFLGGINPEELNVLESFDNLSLFGKFDKAEQLLIGEWYVRDIGMRSILFEKEGKAIESVGVFCETHYNRNWSFVACQEKNSNPLYVLHVGVPGLDPLEVVYIDEHIVYAYNILKYKVFFVKTDSVELFKTNDDIISYFSSIENRARTVIKESGKQHEFKTRTAVLSADTSTQKKEHWIWKVLRVLLWVAVIWGILILIYVIPALGVPVAALAGYVGVKMTKKEEKK